MSWKSRLMQCKAWQQSSRHSRYTRTDLTDAHVGPGAHVVGLEVKRLLIGCDGFRTLAGVGQGGAQLVPEGVVLGPHLQGCSEGCNCPVVVSGQVVEHSQGSLQSCGRGYRGVAW